MNIQEATKLAMEKGFTIYRTSQFDEEKGSVSELELIPTNIYGYVVVHPRRITPYKGWIPNAEDLMADDWEVSKLTPKHFAKNMFNFKD
ncbi:Thoeris anti-defense Tad2 family protein [Staphylococcus delphini]|uniref:Thoeris anti-defense Tad2 family protein n=1 Tax=Staphylococcus delphini TaxID=53344 RepID=UPI003364BB16